jgi:polyisoprenoid-binding protein YceI
VEVAAVQGGEASWTLEAGGSIEWTGNKPGGGHSGSFENLSGYADVGEGNSLQSMVVQIEMSSLTSDKEKLTKHLKDEDFFDIGKYPTSTFTFSSFEEGMLKGELEMVGQTESIVAPVSLTWSEDALKVQGDFSIDRTRWGVSYHSKALGTVADKIIDDQVPLSIDLSFKAP